VATIIYITHVPVYNEFVLTNDSCYLPELIEKLGFKDGRDCFFGSEGNSENDWRCHQHSCRNDYESKPYLDGTLDLLVNGWLFPQSYGN